MLALAMLAGCTPPSQSGESTPAETPAQTPAESTPEPTEPETEKDEEQTMEETKPAEQPENVVIYDPEKIDGWTDPEPQTSIIKERIAAMLSVKSIPVPNPCGRFGLSVDVHCAMAFSPMFDSRAEVTHEPIPRCAANSIQSSEPLIPP